MRKRITTLMMFLGGIVGSYIPTLWGAATVSMVGLFFGAAGAIVGIWIAFSITKE